MSDKTKEELISLLDKLRVSTFTGTGTSKWYPEGSQTAYYRMEYSPAKLIVKHKSPWSSVEERYEVGYLNPNDCNCASIEIYAGANLYKKYSEKDINEDDDALGLMNKSCFKDPRWMLEAAETWQEITGEKIDKRAYSIKVFDLSSLDPDFGPRVFAELFVENGILKMMRIRKFIGKKEIFSQNMDITFQF